MPKVASSPKRAFTKSPSSSFVAASTTTTRDPNIPNRDILEAFDPINKKLYLYQRAEFPSCSTELYVIDITTRGMTDLSAQLRHFKPNFSLCARENTQACVKPLPSLYLSSFTFTSLNSVNYLILFGGEEIEDSKKKPLSDLIFIDVDNLRWWREPFEGAMRPRNGAAITAFNGRIFIFSGHDPTRRGTGTGVNSLPSYSVLEFNNEMGKWVVIQADVPYPKAEIGRLSFKQALPVYDDRQIFLTPLISQGSVDRDVELTPDNICFFDPNNFTFQAIRFPPDTIFPKTFVNLNVGLNVGQYHGMPFEALITRPEPERYNEWLRQTFIEKADGEVAQTDLWNLYKKTFSTPDMLIPLLPALDVIKNVEKVFPGTRAQCGGPHPFLRYYIKGMERRNTLAIEYTYHPYREGKSESKLGMSESILIAGWKCGENGKEGLHEMWKLSLFPDNKIVRLDVSDKLEKADKARHAVVVGDQVYLFSSTDTWHISEDEKMRHVESVSEFSIDE